MTRQNQRKFACRRKPTPSKKTLNMSIRPKTFAHIVFRTYRFEEMRDWFMKVFDGKIQYQNPVIAFIT